METRLSVDRWRTQRPQWNYAPVLWFYFRMIEVAVLDAHCGRLKEPTDEALLARDWIACSEPPPVFAERKCVSFEECCNHLGLNADVERLALLEEIDRGIDFDADEAWTRLESLIKAEPKDDDEPLFASLRVVPVLDQLMIFAA
jgi:hypothetical protein